MDIALASIVSLFSSGGFCYLTYLLGKKSSQLREYQGDKLYTPSSLLNELNQPDSTLVLEPNPKNPREFSFNAFIEGNIECRNAMRSRTDGDNKLIYSELHRKEIFAHHFLTRMSRTWMDLSAKSQPEIQGPPTFTLRDPHTRDSCQVRNNLSVDASGAVDKIDERIRPNKPEVLEKIMSLFMTFGSQTSLIRKNLFGLTGLSIGWTETEWGISLGSALTVYGRVIYDSGKKTLRIDTPLYFLKEKATLIRRLGADIAAICCGGVILLIMFGLSASYLAKKINEYRKDKKQRQIELEKELQVKKRFSNLQDDHKCIICVDNPRNVILEPCKHLSICAKCYNQLPRKLCPVCKNPVKDIMRVSFFA